MLEWKQKTQYIYEAGVSAQQIEVVKPQKWPFYNHYHNLERKGCNISPEDDGAHMISFTKTPGVYQPMGHFNASRSREFELLLGLQNDVQCELILEAQAINFLYVSNGNAVLRFTA